MECPKCRVTNEPSDGSCRACGAPLTALTIVRGTVLAGRYEIRETLGRGGMGTVYKAHDLLLDETVAIKALHPDMANDPEVARRFVSEIKLARKVRHENVCGIHEYGEDGATRFIAMEFVEGVDLRHVVRGRGRLPQGQAWSIALQIARGLQAIHECGIIHRDLKTSNLMFDPRGTVRVMDFGIAKQSGSEATLAGMVLGTPEYMSPEQAQGRRVDFRSDLYALGIVIFEIFTGRPPFRGDSMVSVILQQINDPPPLDAEEPQRLLPTPLVPVLRRALQKDPAERFANAGAFATALEQAHAEWRASAPADAPAEAPGQVEPQAPTLLVGGPAAATRLSHIPTVLADRATEVMPVDRPATPRSTELPTTVRPAPRPPSPPKARALDARGGPALAPWIAAGVVVLAAAGAALLLGQRRAAIGGATDGAIEPSAPVTLQSPAAAPPVPALVAEPSPTTTATRPTPTSAPASAGARVGQRPSGAVVAAKPPAAVVPPPPLPAGAAPAPVPAPVPLTAEGPTPIPPPRTSASLPPIALPPGAPRPIADPGNRPPVYPRAQYEAGVEGAVILKLLVSETGAVLSAEPLSGEEPFARAAVEAAHGWRYRPIVIDGVSRAVYFVVPIPFRKPRPAAPPVPR